MQVLTAPTVAQIALPSPSSLSQTLSLRSDFKHSLARFRSYAFGYHAPPFFPACSPSPTAQMVQFRARRQVDVPFSRGARSPEAFVEDVERVVRITFPDSSRIRYLGDSEWRAQLKPVTFFGLSATPVCDVRVYHENSALQVISDKLVLDLVGLTNQLQHLDLKFSLRGQLSVSESNALAARNGQDKSFQGWVNLSLGVDLPVPFSLIPEAIVTPVGDGILDRILGAMQSSLLSGLIRDYNAWCRTRSEDLEVIMSS